MWAAVSDNKQRRKEETDLVHPVQDGPLGQAVTDTLTQVHEVIPSELHASEGGNELLDTFYHISHLH